ncbi:MAG: inorganic phosphate transporter [bacterium]|nr:inorganic phosphate transporter [bacterium]
MSMLLVGMTIFMGVAIGWSIGANDAANSLGTAVGARVLKLSQAIVLISIMGMLGAYLEGGYVIKTIGKGIVNLDALNPQTATMIAMVSAFAGCAWVALATVWGMPISTSHSIVGAVAGAGLAFGVPVKWPILRDVFVCWLVTPVGAAVLSFIVYFVMKKVFYRVVPRRYARRVLSALIVLSGSYVAYTWGANDVANAVGVIAGANILTVKTSVLIGGLAIVLGIITYGYKVIQTVGSGIVFLVPLMAFSAQLASSINVHIYTLYGIPVSTSHSIVGAIVGVGLVRGMRVLNFAMLREILVCWVLTPFISGLVSFLVCKLVHLIW